MNVSHQRRKGDIIDNRQYLLVQTHLQYMIMTHKERYTCKIYIISIHVGATLASACICTYNMTSSSVESMSFVAEMTGDKTSSSYQNMKEQDSCIRDILVWICRLTW